MADYHDVLIVGTGHAGAQAAIALRQNGYAGTLAIISEEPDPPYERPSLSKEYLAGEKTFERLLIRPEAFWAERNVELLLGQRVVDVNPQGHFTTLEDGSVISYGKLIWAAGGRPRGLTCDGSDLARVHTIRNRADANRIMGDLPNTRSLVIIGGGYIGLEAAAVLTALNKKVTLLEALDRVLGRVAGLDVSRFFELEHRARGVALQTSVTVEAITGEGVAAGVRLMGGEVIPADMVIVGIGILPAIDQLAAAGATVRNGVVVDKYCRTSLPDIYAVGDCAAHESPFARGDLVRIESVQNATDQGTTAAKHIAGAAEPYDAIPWFWSKQYDLKLQTVGLSIGHDETVLRGDPADRSFSVIYLRSGKVVALDCVNATKDFVQGRKLVAEGTIPDRHRLADQSIPLNDV